MTLELGQMFFGNPTEEHPVDRDKRWLDAAWEDLIERLVEVTGENDWASYRYGLDFKNDVFAMRPYYWGEDEEEAAKPNFEVFAEGFRMTWYKYPFRSAFASEPLTKKRWRELIALCLASLPEEVQA